jgi:hypothetical protein
MAAGMMKKVMSKCPGTRMKPGTAHHTLGMELVPSILLAPLAPFRPRRSGGRSMNMSMHQDIITTHTQPTRIKDARNISYKATS